MARHGILVVLAATVLSVGVNAGPCKPYSSVALSSTIAVETTPTTLETTSSIITADVTDTIDFLETTVTEPATGSTETTDALESTITESATDTSAATSATLEPTTTTAAGPGPCVETQILVNPSFDDNNDGSPWVLGAGVTVSQIDPRSAPNFLINGQTLQSSATLTDSGPYDQRFSSQFFTAQDQGSPATLSVSVQCQGSFNTIIIGTDDFSLTRTCGN
ncbi:hypothetical protein ACKRZS_007356 [Fusarium odoratissimum]|uniref:Uncharacterized protein n=2 Tax=Fusarium oxysporum species complex TaxID=171631 RepID=X0JI89_FUSO5|nr:uncharacterized protein FOIG_11662 [Fusarium odoratissimum NRRL 54006]EXL96116.1 hypothetical protein FOIG_11662 [Fusarium odoratissimum NRRL 54006]KAK2123895.1 hypothetical protein NOF04DRAFT_10011 [Fusarium oxysporum II5]TXB96389.1 hypothetical protein FocTR4_00016345 [Fusarium oxysporum f. sp. cubense]